MDLGFIDKLILLLKTSFSSFLFIELFLVFLIVLIFLIYNEKVQDKRVKLGVFFLLLFIVSLLTFLFNKDISYLLSVIIKTILNAFYFPNLVFYVLTVLITFITLIKTIYSNKDKLNKIITYIFATIHLFLFSVFITESFSLNLSLSSSAKIYQHNELFVIVYFSQIIFFFYFIYRLVVYLIRKLKKYKKNAIMDRK